MFVLIYVILSGHMIMKVILGNSVVVQWLGLSAFTVVGLGSIPGWGSKILQAAQHGQKKRKEKIVIL